MTAVLTAEAIQVGPDLAAWFAAGGGTGLERALADPAGIIPALESAGLCGLGGAGFPTHRKWTAVAAQPPFPGGGGKWIICNGNEDEPGTFKDRFLLSRTPHQVIEGALIGAIAVRANRIVLYVNPREAASVDALHAASAAWRGHPLLVRVGGEGRFERREGKAAHPRREGRERRADAAEQCRDLRPCDAHPGPGRGVVPGARPR